MLEVSGRTIGAVLFDFDGVLIRSLEDHYSSWNAILSEFGVTLQWDEFAVTEGQSLFAIARQFCKNHSIDPSHAEDIAKRKNELYLSTAKIKSYDGVFPLLDFLQALGIPMGVVTGAHRDRFNVSASPTMLAYFKSVVTADEVGKTKPNPEPYLTAASSLGVAPTGCLVVENAPLGIQAAKNAGMWCYAVTTTLDSTYLEGADWTGKDLVEFLRFLKTGVSS